MKLNVIDTDSKDAKLTVASNREVRIKLNRHWDDETKTGITQTLTKVAENVLSRNLTYTLRGKYNPKYPKIQLKSANKRNPKVLNVDVEEILSQ